MKHYVALLLATHTLFCMERSSLDDVKRDLTDAKRAVITGIAGQDGTDLSLFLKEKEPDTHIIGLVRPTTNTKRLEYTFDGEVPFRLMDCDLGSTSQVDSIMRSIKPDEVYCLAGQSNVVKSWKDPQENQVNIVGVATFLAAIEAQKLAERSRLVFSGSSEIFGDVATSPQDELTPHNPRNPYGTSKEAAWRLLDLYRRQKGEHASCAYLYNHTGIFRGSPFAEKQIIKDIVLAHDPSSDRSFPIQVGNVEAQRDWNASGEVVRGMHLMLQQEEPGDYVLSSGTLHKVRDLVEMGFAHYKREIRWDGSGLDEKGYDAKTGELLVEVDRRFYRPAEVVPLCGNPQKAYDVLGWKTEKTFEELVSEMIESEKIYVLDPERCAW